jgi:hypothetical protein
MLSAAANPETRYPRIYYNLMVVSLLGAIYRRHDEAEICSTAVETTLKDASRYRMYKAIAKGIGGDATPATELLERHLESNPDDDRAKVTLAVAMMLGGNPGWKAIIDKVLALSTDIPAREAATSVLNYLSAFGTPDTARAAA